MFSPLLYSLDSLLPFVNLRQKDYWLPDPSLSCNVGNYKFQSCGKAVRYYLLFHILAGWILATLFIAGISGIVRRE